jgi:hypothetical protein
MPATDYRSGTTAGRRPGGSRGYLLLPGLESFRSREDKPNFVHDHHGIHFSDVDLDLPVSEAPGAAARRLAARTLASPLFACAHRLHCFVEVVEDHATE